MFKFEDPHRMAIASFPMCVVFDNVLSTCFQLSRDIYKRRYNGWFPVSCGIDEASHGEVKHA